MNILCRKLEADVSKTQFKEIAGLIYDTDPYIYPAMFNSKEEAEIIIPKMILANDTMFNSENIFIALSDDHVVGLVLWHRGPLNWNEDIYLLCGGNSPHWNEVKNRYFINYTSISRETVSLVNVCTSIRGKGVGLTMLNSFMRIIRGPYELYVLADNHAAAHLYTKLGFVVTETTQGFSLRDDVLLCYKMEKYI